MTNSEKLDQLIEQVEYIKLILDAANRSVTGSGVAPLTVGPYSECWSTSGDDSRFLAVKTTSG